LTNIENVYRYHPRHYPGRILHLRASEAVRGTYLSSTGTWEALAKGGVEEVPVSGSHYTMVTEPFVRDLAERLRIYLDAAEHAAHPAAEPENRVPLRESPIPLN
jgi:thioesterase domain-containing protein